MADAKRDPVSLASFRALRLNLGTSETVEAHLLQPGLWAAAEGSAAEVGGYVLGVDLGSTEAMSAAAGFYPETGRLDAIGCFGDDPDVKARGLRDGCGNLYQKMEARGELVLTSGKVSDVRQLIGEVEEKVGDTKRHRVRQVAGTGVKDGALARGLAESTAHQKGNGIQAWRRGRARLPGRLPSRTRNAFPEPTASVSHGFRQNDLGSGGQQQTREVRGRWSSFPKP